MAIPNQQREIYKIAVGMFGAAPGVQYFNELNNAINAGMSLTQIYNVLVNSPAFQSQGFAFTPAATNQQFVNAFLDKLLGPGTTNVTAEGRAFAESFLLGQLNAGRSRGEVIKIAVDALDAVNTSDPNFVGAANRFDNQIAAAQFFTETLSGTSADVGFLQSRLALVTSDAATVQLQNQANLDQTGVSLTFTDKIDNLSGGPGNDTFVGDDTTITAADSANGGGGTDLLSLFGTVTLPQTSSIEGIIINNFQGAVDISGRADVKFVGLKDTTVTNNSTVFTVATGQSVQLQNVDDADEDNTDGIEINSAAGVTALSIGLNKVGATKDVNIDVNGTGVATLNVDSSGTASRVAIENTGAAIRTLNITGNALLTVEQEAVGADVGDLATKIAITNTAGASVVSAAAPDATTGLVITAVGGADSVTLAQAAGANALTDKTSVDLGGGNDTLSITNLNAATDIQTGATFKGGDGTDTLNIVNGALLANNTVGGAFSGFETLSLNGSTGTFDLARLVANNTINSLTLTKANSGAIVVNNLAEAATVTIGANLTGGDLEINQKDAGAGSPNDVMTITFNSKTALDTTGNIDINDIETVNVNVQSSGTDITHEVDMLTADQATTINVNASTAILNLLDLEADALVLFDASASVKGITVVTGGDTFTATSGVLFKGGAAADTFDLTGADTAGAGLDFIVQGGGGADSIILPGAGGRDDVRYTAQSDSTATDFDAIQNFTTTEDKLDLRAFGFGGTADDAVKTVVAGVSINASGDIAVTTGASQNFFDDGGLDRAVAEAVVGGDLFVFVDVNKNGDFDAAGDLVIQLTGLGAAGFAVGDVLFS